MKRERRISVFRNMHLFKRQTTGLLCNTVSMKAVTEDKPTGCLTLSPKDRYLMMVKSTFCV